MKLSILGIRSLFSFVFVLGSGLTVSAQTPAVGGEGPSMWPLALGLIFVSGCVAFIFWYRNRNVASDDQYVYENRLRTRSTESDIDEGVDAEKELEWLRKAKRSSPRSKQSAKKTSGSPKKVKLSELSIGHATPVEEDPQSYQERLKKQQFANLPINSFLQLADPREYVQLPISGDPALLSAIEQANEEFEDDEAVRELALRILSAFKTRNSVEALTQIALYDLSSNLRSKAVGVLTDFDHESVFETVLLACADPSREVRAAAARGLFKLSFDRANAWRRISASSDEYLRSHTARAAIESGIAAKSFDRLVHYDMKIAYEAFSLVGLLILSGETNEIFQTIKNGRDEGVKYALLHVLSIVKDERAQRELNKLRIDATLAEPLRARVEEIVNEYQLAIA